MTLSSFFFLIPADWLSIANHSRGGTRWPTCPPTSLSGHYMLSSQLSLSLQALLNLNPDFEVSQPS